MRQQRQQQAPGASSGMRQQRQAQALVASSSMQLFITIELAPLHFKASSAPLVLMKKIVTTTNLCWGGTIGKLSF
jgi:hypothetical protein